MKDTIYPMKSFCRGPYTHERLCSFHSPKSRTLWEHRGVVCWPLLCVSVPPTLALSVWHMSALFIADIDSLILLLQLGSTYDARSTYFPGRVCFMYSIACRFSQVFMCLLFSSASLIVSLFLQSYGRCRIVKPHINSLGSLFKLAEIILQ